MIVFLSWPTAASTKELFSNLDWYGLEKPEPSIVSRSSFSSPIMFQTVPGISLITDILIVSATPYFIPCKNGCTVAP